MATYLFQRIASQGAKAGINPKDVEASRDWFRDKASSVGAVKNIKRDIMGNDAQAQQRITGEDIGKMFHFFYDPKLKKSLPYFDKFPLIFVLEQYSDGFLGMNLHYLPPLYRARLMDALYSVSSDDRLNATKKLQISYSLLASAKKYRYFAPCVKRYLNSQVRSRFISIPPQEWDIALLMPTERFSKKSKSAVWNESKSIINRR